MTSFSESIPQSNFLFLRLKTFNCCNCIAIDLHNGNRLGSVANECAVPVR